jgi:nucleoside-diphosphate-sugar epimerase
MPGAARTDAAAIEAFGEVLAGSGRPLVMASGVLGLAVGRPGVEDDRPDAAVHPRIANADRTVALAEQGVRSVVVRFAPTVHGTGDHGFVPRLIHVARERGVAAFVGDGTNRWPAVHVLDAARLVRLALTDAPAGSVLHAVADEGVAARDIAAAIGRGLGLPVTSVAAGDASEHFGWIGQFFAADCPTSSARTRTLLGWEPQQSDLLSDLAQTHYFAGA